MGVSALSRNLLDLWAKEHQEKFTDLVPFRTVWQHGGAATAWVKCVETQRDGMVKLPVKAWERRWHRRIRESRDPDLAPDLFAIGDTIGNVDFAWIVMERIRGNPLHQVPDAHSVEQACEAFARFQKASRPFAVQRRPAPAGWLKQIEQTRKSLQALPQDLAVSWRDALDALAKYHDEAIAAWRYRPIKGWVHGDAHLGNILRTEQDEVHLIDFAEVRAGHWVEDAIALERPLWQRPELLSNMDPVDMMAGYRRQLGLPVRAEDGRLAAIR
ncbi:MAG: aminoglycoside phosphotransferase family protein, partial [Planctomycetota bacterium]